jgi:hypothetical protein
MTMRHSDDAVVDVLPLSPALRGTFGYVNEHESNAVGISDPRTG